MHNSFKICRVTIVGLKLLPLYIIGRIITYTRARKRKREERQRELKDKIRQLEQQHKRNPTSSLLNTLKETHRDLNRLITEKVEGNLRFTNQKYYKNGNRASRLLAFRLKTTII